MSERVKVAIRINPKRPQDTDSLFDCEQGSFHGDDCYKLTIQGQALSQEEVGVKKRQFDGTYYVDDVLDGDITQRDVWQQHFEQQIMDKVLDSETGHAKFGVTLMAYGQTGSGKTFTMMGPEECKQNPMVDGDIHDKAGICLRLCHSLFEKIEGLQDSCSQITTTVTMGLLELYNEKMYDLLIPAPHSDPDKRRPLSLGNNAVGIWPRNQTMNPVRDLNDVAKQLIEGYKNVTMGATKMNERSSRGHTIITVKVTTSDKTAAEQKVARIQVVDLAGSERASATDGEAKTGGVKNKGTLGQAISINKALFNLGLMVEAAAKEPTKVWKDKMNEKWEKLKQAGHDVTDDMKQKEVRKEVLRTIKIASQGSILTKLLLDSIGGNVLSFLIVAVRDEREFFAEIKGSLDFGKKCRAVTNSPKEALDASTVQEKYDALKQQFKELEQQRNDLLKRVNEGAEGSDSEKLITRITAILENMTVVQDQLIEHDDKVNGLMEQKLDLLETWLKDTDYERKIKSNTNIDFTVRQLQARSVMQRLQMRIHEPAVRMPRVPVLLCENPTVAGILSITLHPGISFGTDGSNSVVIGSQSLLEDKRQVKKEIDYLKAKARIIDESQVAANDKALQDKEAELEEIKKKYAQDKISTVVTLLGSGVEEQHCRLSLKEVESRMQIDALGSGPAMYRRNSVAAQKKARQFHMCVTGIAHTHLERGGNRETISPQTEKMLEHGDRLVVGEVSLLYVEPDKPPVQIAGANKGMLTSPVFEVNQQEDENHQAQKEKIEAAEQHIKTLPEQVQQDVKPLLDVAKDGVDNNVKTLNEKRELEEQVHNLKQQLKKLQEKQGALELGGLSATANQSSACRLQ